MLAKNFRLKIHLGDSITDLEAGKGRERRKKKKFYSSVMTWSWLSRDRIKHPMQKSMPGRGDAPSQESGRTIWHLQIIHVVLTASGATATVWNAHNTVSTWQVLTDFFFFRSMRMETILPADCQFVHLPSWDFAFNETQLHYIDGTLGWR